MNPQHPRADRWIKLIPRNTGGGRPPAPPSARIDKHHSLCLNKETGRLLGFPSHCMVEVNPARRAIRLTPTTPDNSGGFALSGGGNSMYRIRSQKIEAEIPDIEGVDLEVKKLSGMIELTVPPME